MAGRTVFVAAALSMLPAAGLCQSTSAVVSGPVRGSDGSAVGSAQITIRNQQTGAQIATQSDSKGRFEFTAVAAGKYSLRAEHPEFATLELSNLSVALGSRLTVEVLLDRGVAREEISVVGEEPLIDHSRPEVAAVLDAMQVSSLPISGRQYLSLILVLPGTGNDASRAFFSAVNIGSSITFNSTGNLVDGTTNTWAEDGEPRQDIPVDAIQELRVTNTPQGAEFGLATGGVVQLLTRSGANKVFGSLFGYFQDDALNAKGPVVDVSPHFQRKQTGGSFGGPIRRDRAHFFFSAERTRQKDVYTVRTGLPEFYSSLEGTFAADSSRDLYIARFDLAPTNTQSLFVRYAHEDESTTCNGCGGTVAATGGFDQRTPRRSLAGGHNWTGRSHGNELRLQYARGSYYIKPHEGPRRAFVFPSLTYGGSIQDEGPEERQELRDTMALVLGAHSLRFGVDCSRLPYSQVRTGNLFGTYTFAEDQLFDPNDPNAMAALNGAITFSAVFPRIRNHKTTRYYSAFVQDELRLGNITLSGGLRGERLEGISNDDLNLQTFPVSLPYVDLSQREHHTELAPRLGIVWSPQTTVDWVVRGGYGVYYGHVRVGANLTEYRNYQQFTVNITNPQYPDPYDGQDPFEFVASGPANITILANDFRQPRARSLTLGTSLRLGIRGAIHVDAVESQTRRDRKIQDLNPRDSNGNRPLSEFGRIDQHRSSGAANFRALYVRAERRFDGRWQGLLSYSYTDSEDNNPLVRYLDHTNESLDWGPSNSERHHALVSSISIRLPWKLVAGAVWTYKSELPWSATAGRDLNGDGFNSDLVPGTTRNSGGRRLDLAAVNEWRRSNGMAPVRQSQINSSRLNSLDLRLSKSIGSVEFVAQVFNVANTTNLQAPFVGGRVTNALSSSFGRILTARPGRQIEVGIRLEW